MPIKVNDIEITDDELHQEMQFHPADSLQQVRQKAAYALIIKQVLIQQAKKNNLLGTNKINSPEDEEKAIDQLLKQNVTVPEADTLTCCKYYQQNLQRFVDKNTGKTLPFESVRCLILEYLHTRSLRTGIIQYIKLLISKAHIIGIDIEANEIALY